MMKKIIASGIIEPMVGYIDYEKDGVVANGLEDEIDYNSTTEQLDNFILEQQDYEEEKRKKLD